MDTPAPAPPSVGTSSPATEPAPATRGPRVVVPAIDGFRGVAALWVLLYHVSYGAGLAPLAGLRSVFVSGYVGVDFFFVISGFVLFLPTVLAAGSFGSVRGYGIRRVARILPAYYVVLVVAVLVQPLLSASRTAMPWDGRAGAVSFLLHLTFLQHTVGLLRAYPEGFLVLGVVWTLSLEATFYVVLPLVASWYFRHPFVGLAVAFVVSMAWKLSVVHASFSVGWLPATASPKLLRLILVTQFPTYLTQFAAGMTVAWLFVRWRGAARAWLPWVAVGVQVAAVVAIVWAMRAAGIRDLTATTGTYDHWADTLPMALPFAALVLATVLAPRWAQSPMTNPAARGLGDVSYGVYLWHTLIIGFVVVTVGFDARGTTGAFLSLLAVTLVGAIALGTLSLVFVERPAIRWGRRASKRIEASGPGRRPRRPTPTAEDVVGAPSAW